MYELMKEFTDPIDFEIGYEYVAMQMCMAMGTIPASDDHDFLMRWHREKLDQYHARRNLAPEILERVQSYADRVFMETSPLAQAVYHLPISEQNKPNGDETPGDLTAHHLIAEVVAIETEHQTAATVLSEPCPESFELDPVVDNHALVFHTRAVTPRIMVGSFLLNPEPTWIGGKPIIKNYVKYRSGGRKYLARKIERGKPSYQARAHPEPHAQSQVRKQRDKVLAICKRISRLILHIDVSHVWCHPPGHDPTAGEVITERTFVFTDARLPE